MSAPSFSSFSPSFSSFPESGTGPSHRPSESSNDRKAGDKKRKKPKRTRPDSESHGKAEPKKDYVEIADLPPSVLSDRKGDPLNIRYGGPHARDVPKYHVVGRMSFPEFLGDL
jgi:hypothetical protein